MSRSIAFDEVVRVSLDGDLNRSSGDLLVVNDGDRLGGEGRVNDDAGRQRNIQSNGVCVRGEGPADWMFEVTPELPKGE